MHQRTWCLIASVHHGSTLCGVTRSCFRCCNTQSTFCFRHNDCLVFTHGNFPDTTTGASYQVRNASALWRNSTRTFVLRERYQGYWAKRFLFTLEKNSSSATTSLSYFLWIRYRVHNDERRAMATQRRYMNNMTHNALVAGFKHITLHLYRNGIITQVIETESDNQY